MEILGLEALVVGTSPSQTRARLIYLQTRAQLHQLRLAMYITQVAVIRRVLEIWQLRPLPFLRVHLQARQERGYRRSVWPCQRFRQAL